MSDLLSPTNDYVFKRLFGESPDLLLHLINDLRYDLPNIASVDILNPTIEPSELKGKYIMLDVLRVMMKVTAIMLRYRYENTVIGINEVCFT